MTMEIKLGGELLNDGRKGRGRMSEPLGKYGHHPDCEIDADIEVERLQGLLYEARAGLLRGLDYRAATPEGLSIKYDLRDALRRTGLSGDLARKAE